MDYGQLVNGLFQQQENSERSHISIMLGIFNKIANENLQNQVAKNRLNELTFTNTNKRNEDLEAFKIKALSIASGNLKDPEKAPTFANDINKAKDKIDVYKITSAYANNNINWFGGNNGDE